jgi:glucose/arabinose dehydrogenase
MARGSRLTATLAAALAAIAALTACSGGSGSSGPTFSPQPSFAGDGAKPGVPEGPAQPSLAPATTQPGSPAPTAGRGGQTDPAIVATRLTTPVGIAILPDNTALVGERSTGRIVRVQPNPGQPVQPVRTLHGLSTTGDGGLLDLALSPTYSEDNLIFAYITTPTDNRVVTFTLTGPVTPVLTGIPRGATENTGRIVFGADGSLYIGTGDAGVSADSGNVHSLAGKVLRVTDIGNPAAGNPYTAKTGSPSPVYSVGFKQVDALCTDATASWIYEAETRGDTLPDAVSLITAGDDYGWPGRVPAAGQTLSRTPDTSRNPGGCAVQDGVLYVTSRDGAALLGAPLTVSGATPVLGAWTVYLRQTYGRLRSVVAAADGALWLTTSNRDGSGRPIPADERVIRIQPPAQGGHSPA